MRTLTTAQSQVVTNQVRRTAARFRCRDAVPPTTIAAGSSGVSVPATLNVASAAAFAYQGTGICAMATAGKYGVFTWTGKTSTSLTGCTWNTTGNIATTGGTVASTPDYTFLGGANAVAQQNWLMDVSRTENVDSYMATSTIHLARDNYSQSTAPLMTQSVINNGGQALALHRECWIETAVLPMNGIAPVATDWLMVFHGFVDTIDWATDPLTLTASDLCGELQKTQMELAYDYGIWDPGHTLIVGYRAQASGQSAVPPSSNSFAYWFEVTTAGKTQGGIWQPSTAFVNTHLGDIVSPTVADQQGQQRYFRCTTSGTSGTAEPTWPPFGTGAPTVNDNTVVWTELNIDAAVTTSSSPQAVPDPLTTWLQYNTPGSTGFGDGTTIAEFGSSTLVWTLRVPNPRVASPGAGSTYTAGQVIYTANGNLSQYWLCVVGGTTTTSSSTSGFPLTPNLGQVITDNTASGGTGSAVTWSAMGTPGGNLAEVVIQQLLNDFNARISMTLAVVPNGSNPNTGFYFGLYRQQQEDVLSAVSALALQVGYDLRMLWNAAIGDFSLTLSYVKRPQTTQLLAASAGATLPVATLNVANTNGYAASGTLTVPTTTGISSITYSGVTATTFTGCSGGTGTLGVAGARVVAVPAVTPATTYAASYYKDIQTLKQDISLIRNRGGLTYTDNSYINGLNNAYDYILSSTPQRKYITDSDPASSAASAYGPLYFAVSEGSTLQTDNPTSALAFLDTIISDLSQPVLNQTVLMKYQPHLQMNDQVQMTANFVHYDTDQIEAVVSMTDTISPKAATTVLGLRGNPTAGFRKYHNKAVAQGNVPVPVIKPQAPATGLAATATFAGGKITFNPPLAPRLNWQYTEVHLSKVSGFVPSPATLATGGVAFAGVFVPQGLTPGAVYYCRLVHRFKRNTGSYTPTPQSKFTTLGQNFSAKMTSAQIFGATPQVQVMKCNTKIFDPGAVYSTSTGAWTPTVAGTYRVNVICTVDFNTGTNQFQFLIKENISGNYIASSLINGSLGATGANAPPAATLSLDITISAANITAGNNYTVVGNFINKGGVVPTSCQFSPEVDNAAINVASPGCQFSATQLLSA